LKFKADNAAFVAKVLKEKQKEDEAFENWKKEQGLVPTGFDTKTKFQVDNKIYHCINSITSVRGHIYSGIIETQKGKERKDYEQIIQAAMVAIKNL
jgi:hypothetical protein